jgi:hypothetical protein
MRSIARASAMMDQRAGRIRTACPPPGARETVNVVLEVTLTCEIEMANGLLSQCASGPSAYTSAT